MTQDSLGNDMQLQVKILPDGRLDTANTALYLGLKPKTLAMWRTSGEGPQFVKIGGRVFYFKADLDAWIDQQGKAQSTAQSRFLQAQNNR